MAASAHAEETEAEQINVTHFRGSFFELFNQIPILGRVLRPDEGEANVVLSYGLWQSQFAGSRFALGKTLYLNGDPWTVVGVMPVDFLPPCLNGLNANSLWLSTVALPLSPRLPAESARFFDVFASLSAGLDVRSALARLNGKSQDGKVESILGPHVDMVPVRDWRADPLRSGIAWIQVAAGLVLLVTWANLAHLMLMQFISRSSEFAIRTSIGATRFRLISQLVTEGSMLGLCAAVLALWLAHLALPILSTAATPLLSRSAHIAIGVPDVLFAVALALCSALVFGGAPALFAIQKQSWRKKITTNLGRFRLCLVATEVAVSVVILVCASLSVRSFWNVTSEPIGFDARNLLVADFHALSGMDAKSFASELESAAQARLGGMPVALSTEMPFSYFGSLTTEWDFRPVGASDGATVLSHVRATSRGYFSALGVPLIRGRLPAHSESEVALVNQRFVAKYARGHDVLGAILKPYRSEISYTVIGVVGDIRTNRLSFPPTDAVYVLLEDKPMTSLSVAVRSGNVPEAIAALRRVARDVDTNLAVTNVVSVDVEAVRREGGRLFYLQLLVGLGLLAVMLCAIGVIGVVAHAVQARRREFGIRLAVGASKRQIMFLAYAIGVKPVIIGTAVGALTSWWLTAALARNQVVTEQLYRVEPHDWITLSSAMGSLIAIGFACSMFAGRNALKIEPNSILRSE